jgi:hypothetical protein
MRVRSAIAPAVAALALAVPGSALAQGAGDDQYTDPFGSDDSSGSATPTPTPQATAPPSAPAPTAPAPSAPAPSASAAQATPAPAASPGDQLPYTGSPVDAGLLAAAGGVLLAGGLTQRVRLRERDAG